MFVRSATTALVGLSLLLATHPASAFDLGTLLRPAPKISAATENGDEDYPWRFEGRLWFRPALVRVPPPDSDLRPPPSVSMLNLFGWTVGGVVALEYDESPVGPYREYVTMGSVVSKRGALGQWGSKLYVSTDVAQRVCEDVWGVPATLADIEFEEKGVGGAPTSLQVDCPPDGSEQSRQKIAVVGWESCRVDGVDVDSTRYPSGGLPVLWTPTIKALWAPLVPLPQGQSDEELPLHRLRLSASGVRLRFCGQSSSNLLGVPIGIGLVVDNVLIEISRKDGDL